MKIIRILKGAGIRSTYGTMGASASTLVDDEGIKILVDVGHFGNRETLITALRSNDLLPKDIDKIVLTHLNWDHCLNIDLFQNSEVLLSKKEFDLGTLSGTMDGLSPLFKEYLKSFKLTFVAEGDHPSPNSTVLDTGGHTAGHISLLVQDGQKKILISGDSIPNLRSYNRGMPDLIFYNKDEAASSIEKIKKLQPDVIYPGHDPPFNTSGYMEKDTIDLILRNVDETNTIINIYKREAEKPLVIKDE